MFVLEIWGNKRLAAAYPLRDSYEIFRFCGSYMADPSSKFGGIRSTGSKIMGFNLPVRFARNFQRSLAEKLYTEFYRCNTRYELMCHRAEYGRDWTLREGA